MLSNKFELLQKMQLCVICHDKPVMESLEKPTCIGIECQLKYNEAHNIDGIKRCQRCDNRFHSTHSNICRRCEKL